MRQAGLLASLLLLAIPSLSIAQAKANWSKLPALRIESASNACVGVSDGALLFAQPGAQTVSTLTSGADHWREQPVNGALPATAASASSVAELICLGPGSTRALRWTGRAIEQRVLEPLPEGSTPTAATIIGTTLFVSAADVLYSLSLSAQSPQWHTFAHVPGHEAVDVLVAQHDGRSYKLFLVAKRRLWQLDPATARFSPRTPPPQTIAPSSAAALGQSLILFVGSGASGSSWTYHAITDAWSRVEGAAPPEWHSIQRTLAWNGRVAAVGNLQKDAVVEVAAVGLEGARRSLGTLNFVVLCAYLASIVGIGIYCAARNRNTDDYFRGGKSIPWWAAACSIYATMLSSLTYVGLPALVFATDWVLLPAQFMVLGCAPLVVYVAMPFFRKVDSASAYEYLGERFGMPVRLIGSAMFILFHVSRMAIVMALAALALAALTHLSPVSCVLIMGLLCLIYATLGGIEAVIWTDTIQTFILIGGAILCIVFIIGRLDGGVADLIAVGREHNKFTTFDLSFDAHSITRLAFWVVLIGGFGQQASVYVGDQAVVQRYMTTVDTRATARSIWMNGILAGCASILFFVIGTGLYAFYRAHPERLDPGIQGDQIFPLFIGSELPAGVAGLVVAGIFAAAKSTVATTMNSIAATLITDFLRPFGHLTNETRAMQAARLLTLAVGLVGTLAGLLFIRPQIRSLTEEYFKVIGITMGALGGVFLLGMLTRRATSAGALGGMLLSGLITVVVAHRTPVNGYLYATIGIASCLACGYLVSLAAGSGRGSRESLDM